MYILGLPTDIFNVYPAAVRFKTYQTRWEIGDIYVSGDARKTEDNPQGLGCYLVMTGRGCDDIYRILEDKCLTFVYRPTCSIVFIITFSHLFSKCGFLTEKIIFGTSMIITIVAPQPFIQQNSTIFPPQLII